MVQGPLLNLLLGLGTFTSPQGGSPPRPGRQPKLDGRGRLLRVLAFARSALVRRADVDSALYAAIAADDLKGVFRTLDLHISQAAGLASALMRNYRELPSEKAVAMLGLMSLAEPFNQAEILDFLCDRLEEPSPAVARRAALALAVAASVDRQTVHRVASMLATNRDPALELPLVEFFRCHADRVACLTSTAENGSAWQHMLDGLRMPELTRDSGLRWGRREPRHLSSGTA